MKRISIDANGVLKLVAWGLLLLVTALVVWREPTLLFLDDLFEYSFSTRLEKRFPNGRVSDLRHFEPPRRQTVSPMPDDLIAEVSQAGLADLFRKPLESGEPHDLHAAFVHSEAEIPYASRYETPVEPIGGIPERGKALTAEEVPSLALLPDSPAASSKDRAVPVVLPEILDRSKLDDIAPMIDLPGGTFRMGSDTAGERDQRPSHSVRLKPFRIDCYEVTNRQFRMFIRETRYRTSAERYGWSYVFDEKRKTWVRMVGACWWNPTGKNLHAGPESGAVAVMLDFPVVHVSWDDAAAFCLWAGKRLPSEAEWEFAARGGLQNPTYPWGDFRQVNGRQMANYWQGWFPEQNTAADGFPLLAPVGSFPANRYGLHDLGGNAWEWVGDRYLADYYRRSALDNPLGPAPEEGETVSVPRFRVRKEGDRHLDEQFEGIEELSLRVIRGGSFLSAENTDAGYRTTARGSQPQALSFQDVGFRCAE